MKLKIKKEIILYILLVNYSLSHTVSKLKNEITTTSNETPKMFPVKTFTPDSLQRLQTPEILQAIPLYQFVDKQIVIDSKQLDDEGRHLLNDFLTFLDNHRTVNHVQQPITHNYDKSVLTQHIQMEHQPMTPPDQLVPTHRLNTVHYPEAQQSEMVYNNNNIGQSNYRGSPRNNDAYMTNYQNQNFEHGNQPLGYNTENFKFDEVPVTAKYSTISHAGPMYNFLQVDPNKKEPYIKNYKNNLYRSLLNYYYDYPLS